MSQNRPNIVLIMADQLSALALPSYGHKRVHAPNLAEMGDNGIVFDNAYCNSPLCVPSRSSMMAGRLPSEIGVYDNAAELEAGIPTIAHFLRLQGYCTCLIGKMHFIGPDQLHGFEERLTTDVYPAQFVWTPNWRQAEENRSWQDMQHVLEAGPCRRSLQMDFDENVMYHAEQKIFDLARASGDNPFFLTISFTHPHDRYTTTEEFWSLYNHEQIDLPTVANIPVELRDAHSKRLYYHYHTDRAEVTDDLIRNVRHAYYGMISYLDNKVGRILGALKRSGLTDDTVILFTSDHGDMLGERGLWFKKSFFEWSARVPLIVYAPRLFQSGRMINNVSLVDLLPTLVDIAGGEALPGWASQDGYSLLHLLDGTEDMQDREVYGEYLAEGVPDPCFMVLRGRHKYIHSESDPPLLFDLATDPMELASLAGGVEVADLEAQLRQTVKRRWDSSALKRRIIDSQDRRRFISAANAVEPPITWDFQPFADASKQFVRGAWTSKAEGRSFLGTEPVARRFDKEGHDA